MTPKFPVALVTIYTTRARSIFEIEMLKKDIDEVINLVTMSDGHVIWRDRGWQWRGLRKCCRWCWMAMEVWILRLLNYIVINYIIVSHVGFKQYIIKTMLDNGTSSRAMFSKFIHKMLSIKWPFIGCGKSWIWSF